MIDYIGEVVRKLSGQKILVTREEAKTMAIRISGSPENYLNMLLKDDQRKFESTVKLNPDKFGGQISQRIV